MHRLRIDEPYSPMALWSARLAFFAFSVALTAILAAHFGLEPLAVLVVLAAAAGFAGVAFFVGLAAIAVIWRTGRKGALPLGFGLALAGLLLSLPVYLAVQAFRLPSLNDISTDLDNPPLFSISKAALLARGFRTPERLAAALREPQRSAYPGIQTIELDLDAGETFEIILKVAKSNGWQIIETHPPGGRMGLGHIDAIAHSHILNIANDIAIRVRPVGEETWIDVRSVSRPGLPDFGRNAALIEEFSAVLQTEADKAS